MPQDHSHHPHHDELVNADGSWKYTNRLADETSPYLRQHAHNPVDWYPWGEEAFAAARERGVPIFLSIGYSTCYWCHVMERQVFEHPEIAAQMNELFVCVKVDREERPDVDDIYMMATQLMTRRGGWPMSVFLTPPGAKGEDDAGLRPFWCGTYLPPEPMNGMQGFPQIMTALSDAWKDQKPAVIEQSDRLSQGVAQALSEQAEPAPINPLLINQSAAVLMRTYDAVHAGFGDAPKFPQPATPGFLLALQRDNGSDELKAALEHTLDRMARGGMYDQIGGGFHRYSVDEKWLVPHFEKMLYDNGQLAELYTRAWAADPDGDHAAQFQRIAEETCDYVLREMTDPCGAFWSAQDAEVNAMEGGNYVWTAEEVREALDDDALIDLALKMYGLNQGPNFTDPHAENAQPVNVLYLPTTLAELAEAQGISLDDLLAMRERINAQLMTVRDARDQPGTDDKVLTAWNGMMIAGLAAVGGAFGRDDFIQAGARAAEAVVANMTIPEDQGGASGGGGLQRTYRDGVAKIPGFMEDYAHFIHGLIQLHRFSNNGDDYLDWAERYTQQAIDRFANDRGGYFDTLADQSDLFVRTRGTYDGALPSGNSQMIHNLVDLYELTGNEDYAKRAAHDLMSFTTPMNQQGTAMLHMLHAMHRLIRSAPEVLEMLPAPPPQEPPVVISHPDGAVTLTEGKAALALRITIDAGYHISAATAVDETLTATTLGVVGNDAVSLRLHWPEGERKEYPFADQPLEVYEGAVEVTVELTIEGDAPKTIDLMLAFQACTETVCEQPATRTLRVEIAGP